MSLDVRLLAAALTDVEEAKMDAHPECIMDTCHHDECPDWSTIGCGDAQAIADAYERVRGEE